MYRTATLYAALFVINAGSMPTLVAAQSEVRHPADTSLSAVIARIGPISMGVRVASPLTGRVRGDGIILQNESVLLTSVRGVRSIPAADVDSVWVRRGTRALAGALIIGIPGALLGGFFGAVFAGDNTNVSSLHILRGMLHGAALFGVAFGSVGAAMGSLINHWQLVYPRPPSKLVREK